MTKVLFIHPPVVRPSEPPPGLARLAGALTHAGIPYDLLDLNLEGLRHLCTLPPAETDTWTRRAAGRAEKDLSLLSQVETYGNPGRYRQAISNLSRILAVHGKKSGILASLTDYQDETLSPALSSDLIQAYENPERNLFFPFIEKRLSEVLSNATFTHVGLSLNFLSQALCAFAIMGVLRRMAPKISVILGGGLVTSWLKQANFKNPFSGIADHLIAGPGEEKLLGKRMGEKFPLPDYDAVATLSYLSPGLVLPYSASTGCWWRRCAFCPEKAEQNRYHPVPATIAAKQLAILSEKYKPALIHLTDNAVSPLLLKTLAEHPPGAPWYGFVRITKDLADPGFCRALKASGCVMLQIGLESGSQKVLDAFGKGVELNLAEKTLSAMKEAGIASYTYLLFGTPWEREEDARLTLDFTAAHADEISCLNLAVFNLPACSNESETLETSSFYGGDLSLYRDFQHPDGWNRRQVRQFLDKEFTRHPSVARILRSDPPVFTSSHAPFFAMAAS